MQLFPLPSTARYSYAQRFNASHRGTDIMAPAGTPVLAVERGTAWASFEPKGGNVVYLEGESGRRYFYGHLRAVRPIASQRLSVELGTVGNTGNAAGGPPHLHFQYKLNGETVDPFPMLLGVDPHRRGKASSGGDFGSGLAVLVVLWALSRVS